MHYYALIPLQSFVCMCNQMVMSEIREYFHEYIYTIWLPIKIMGDELR